MKVLVAMETSKFGGTAVRAAAKRFWVKGTELRVITVVEGSTATLGETSRQSELSVQTRAAIARKASQAAELLQGKTGTVTYRIRFGNVADEIVAEALRWNADLIMVGTHGRRRLSRFLLGSVAQRVAAAAPCSVEIVRTLEK